MKNGKKNIINTFNILKLSNAFHFILKGGHNKIFLLMFEIKMAKQVNRTKNH